MSSETLAPVAPVMPRKLHPNAQARCKLCQWARDPEHGRQDDVDAIDRMIVRGIPYRKIASRFAGVAPHNVQAHIKHVQQRIVASETRKSSIADDGLLAEQQAWMDQVKDFLERASKANDLKACKGFIDNATGLMELKGKLTGRLSAGGTNVLVQMGVSLESAKSAVELRDTVGTLPPHETAQRAASYLRRWNDAHPDKAIYVAPGVSASYAHVAE